MDNFDFYEVAVAKFCYANETFTVEFEEVGFNSSLVGVRIEVWGVSGILIDKNIIDKKTIETEFLAMPATCNEVFKVKYSGTSLYLLVEWSTFIPLKAFTHSYEINGDRVKVTVI